MDRRDISMALFVGAVGAASTAKDAVAQSCTPPCYPRSQAEINAGVTPTAAGYAYPPLNICRYGADPTGASTSDTAMANAIAVCGAVGGTIVAPTGTYVFANQINLNQKSSIVIQGAGTTNAGATGATVFSYSGTGAGPWILLNSALGVKFVGIQFIHSNSGFSGTYIQCNNDGAHGDPSYCGVYDCNFGANIGTGQMHLDLNTCILFTAERCSFQFGNPSVVGQKSGGYSNVIRFRDCEWFNNHAVPLQNGGESWSFEGCTFEPLLSGAPGALLASASVAFVGLTITGCWFGDATATAGSWLDIYGANMLFSGNVIGGNQAGTTGITLRRFAGASIIGNAFEGLLAGVNFAVANCLCPVVRGNTFNSVTTPVVNGNNVPTGSFDFGGNYGLTLPGSNHGSIGFNGYAVEPYGLIRQWGTASVSNGTLQTVSFPLPFPNACLNVVPALTSVINLNSTIYPSNLTTTGFSVHIQDAAGTDTFFWQAIGY
jgi:hypothetical protein